MLGGHSSRIFQSKPSEKFDCPLCYETLKDPLQCSNGHLFCKMCILSVLERKDRCPLCDTSISISLLSKSLFVQQCIGKLTTFCVSVDSEMFRQSTEESTAVETCAWTGPLHARAHHYETECRYFPTKCDNIGCEVQLLRKTVVEHNAVCIFTHMKCEHCDELVLRRDMANHVEVCVCRPVLCPRNCSAILSFSQVEAHLQNDCPNQKASPSSNTHIIPDTDCTEILDCLTGLVLNGEVSKTQESVTTLSKSSKKNAKKAARRKNPTNTTIVDDTSSGSVAVLNSLVEEFLNAEDNCANEVECTARLKVIKQFASHFKRMLDLCPPSELGRQLTIIFVEHSNSIAKRIKEDRIQWSLIVGYYLMMTFDSAFNEWFLKKTNEFQELMYLLIGLGEVTGTRPTVKKFQVIRSVILVCKYLLTAFIGCVFITGFSFTDWMDRTDYQSNVEISVSGCYDPAAAGKYRFSGEVLRDSFRKVDKSTAHTILVCGTKHYSHWCLCTNETLPRVATTNMKVIMYTQDTTPFSPIPSATIPWKCAKLPAHPNDNKMKISVRRIEM